MEKRSFIDEFKDMLFGHRVILVFLGFIVYLAVTGAVVKDSPVQYFQYDPRTAKIAENIDKVREEFYGKSYEEAFDITNRKLISILGYDPGEYTQASNQLLKLLGDQIKLVVSGNGDKESAEMKALNAEVKELEKKVSAMMSKIREGMSPQDNIEYGKYESVLKEIRNQIRYTGVNRYQDLRAENLFLGRGRFYNRDFNYTAIINFLGLEIALGLIAYLYIRMNDNKNKVMKIASFSVIALFMAALIVLKQFIVTKMNYPAGINNVEMGGILYASTRFRLYDFMYLMLGFWFIYYIARVMIYSKRARNYTLGRSLISFILFNGIMYTVYYNMNVGTFVSLLGEGAILNLTNSMIILGVLITVAAFSFKAYLTGKSLLPMKRSDVVKQVSEE